MQWPQLGFILTLQPTAEHLLLSGDVEVGAVPPGARHPGITHCLPAAALGAYRSSTSVIICSAGCYSLQPWPFGNEPSKCEIGVCLAFVSEKQFCHKSEFCTVAGCK